jgi:hypothetical protein
MTLASGLLNPGALALSGDHLYAANDDPLDDAPGAAEIVRIPLAGGAPAVVASGQGQVQSVVADASNVYWTSVHWKNTGAEPGTVTTLPIGGGAPVVLASGIDFPWGLALDATNLYVGSFFAGDVVKVPIAGGAPTTLVSGSASLVSVWGIAVDSANVYWMANTNNDVLDAGQIMSVPIGGGTPTTLATGQFPGMGLTVDAHYVYWTNGISLPDGNGGTQGPGDIMKVPLDGSGQPQVVAAEQRFPNAVVVDGNDVYWGGGVYDPGNPPSFQSVDSGPLTRAPLAGGAPETVFGGRVLDGQRGGHRHALHGLHALIVLARVRGGG